MCLACLDHQTYPKNRLEWLIYDDGSDPIKDVIDEYAKTTKIQIRYFRSETQLSLPVKRNFLNKETHGSIICFWDDDDYYPPNRIMDGVKALQAHPEYKIVGAESMYCYFNKPKTIWQFGPYNPNHSTAAVFIFRKELLNETQFVESDLLAEEPAFLKNYSIPLYQLPPAQCILIIAHSQNSVDKYDMIKHGPGMTTHTTRLTLEQMIPNPSIRHFICNELEPALQAYAPGDLRNKPDILLEMTKKQNAKIHAIKLEYQQLLYQNEMMKQQLQRLDPTFMPPQPPHAERVQRSLWKSGSSYKPSSLPTTTAQIPSQISSSSGRAAMTMPSE